MNRQGMSLQELMISMTIMALVGSILAFFFINSGRFTRDEIDRVDVDVSANRLLSSIDQYFRQGKQVIASYTDGPTTYTSDGSTLVMTLPSILSDGTLSASDVDTVVFSQSGTILQRRLYPAASSTRVGGVATVTTNLQDLYFRYTSDPPAGSTGVTLTLRTQRQLFASTHTQLSILYGTFRNHP